MSYKGVVLVILSIIMIVSGAAVLATGTEARWVSYGFAIMWAVSGVLAFDYFKNGGK